MKLLALVALAACGSPEPPPAVRVRDAGPPPKFVVRDPEMKDAILTSLTRDAHKRFDRYIVDPENAVAKIETCATFLDYSDGYAVRLASQCIEKLAPAIAQPSAFRTKVIDALADTIAANEGYAAEGVAQALRTIVWQSGGSIDPALASRMIGVVHATKSDYAALSPYTVTIPKEPGMVLLPDVQAYTLEVLSRPQANDLTETAFDAATHITDQALVCKTITPVLDDKDEWVRMLAVKYVAAAHCDELATTAYERLLAISTDMRYQPIWDTFIDHRKLPPQIRARAVKIIAHQGETAWISDATLAHLRGR
ncbi:MAG: hypothetical protein QM831_20915 [Kofleriaceae bacterium]